MLSTLLLHSSTRTSAAARLKLQQCRAKEVLFRVLLSAVVMCTFVLIGMQQAHAAPIGMCADTAQSVAAPPPMFPADDAELRAADESSTYGCQSNNHVRFRAHEPGTPGDRLAPSAEIPDEKVILGALVPVFRASFVPFALIGQDFLLPEEHRWRGLRPPRD